MPNKQARNPAQIKCRGQIHGETSARSGWEIAQAFVRTHHWWLFVLLFSRHRPCEFPELDRSVIKL
jgi:hypothetical protein